MPPSGDRHPEQLGAGLPLVADATSSCKKARVRTCPRPSRRARSTPVVVRQRAQDGHRQAVYGLRDAKANYARHERMSTRKPRKQEEREASRQPAARRANETKNKTTIVDASRARRKKTKNKTSLEIHFGRRQDKPLTGLLPTLETGPELSLGPKK